MARLLVSTALILASCVPQRAKLPHEDDAYAALPESCRPKLDPELAVQMLSSETQMFWVYVSFASFTRGYYYGVPDDRTRFATCTETDCVARLSRERIRMMCNDANVREIAPLPNK